MVDESRLSAKLDEGTKGSAAAELSGETAGERVAKASDLDAREEVKEEVDVGVVATGAMELSLSPGKATANDGEEVGASLLLTAAIVIGSVIELLLAAAAAEVLATLATLSLATLAVLATEAALSLATLAVLTAETALSLATLASALAACSATAKDAAKDAAALSTSGSRSNEARAARTSAAGKFRWAGFGKRRRVEERRQLREEDNAIDCAAVGEGVCCMAPDAIRRDRLQRSRPGQHQGRLPLQLVLTGTGGEIQSYCARPGSSSALQNRVMRTRGGESMVTA